MNIFLIEYDANGGIDWEASARSLDNLRVSKMILETAQLLSTSIHILGGVGPYKITHKNHPCAIYSRLSKSNFNNVVAHGRAMGEEYTRRFKRRHKSSDVIEECVKLARDVDFPGQGETEPAIAIADKSCVSNDVVLSYRKFYSKKEKMRYPKNSIPQWFLELRGDMPFEVV